jgi:hypothetical protein
MKINNIRPIGFVLALIITSFIFLCGITNAQPGYRYTPRVRVPAYRQVIVPNPPAQNYRQYNDPNIQTDGDQPYIIFSLHFDPLISWFSTDSYDTRSDGVVPGFSFGILYNKHFSPNYSFSTGINIINAGGRIVNRDLSLFELKNYNSTILTVQAGEVITYRVTYLSVPLGLKLQTNQIGYGRFFTDVGLDPKIVVGGRADIPSLNIKGGNATSELNTFNLSYHIMAGIEYPLAGNNNFIVGIGYEKYLFDITRDNGDQPSNVVLQKMFSFRLGMTF